jgi:hypothetical protein
MAGVAMTSDGATPDSLENRINAAREQGHVVDNLNSAFNNKPVGEFLLAPKSKDLRYAILIYNIDILPEKATFSAGIAFREPRNNQLIALNTDQVSFYFTQGLTGPVRLYLLKNVITNLGYNCQIEFEGGLNKTWATFDCDGLRDFNITGLARFNQEYLVPLDAKLKPIADSSLTASFRCQASTWDDITASISISPFELKGLNGYAFKIQDAAMDLSETHNPAGLSFPPPYQNLPELSFGIELWEGFYLKNGAVLFPEHFTGPNAPRVEVGINNLFIDKQGFSGSIYGTNLLSLDKGNLGGWRISISRAEVTVLWNSLEKTSLTGLLGLPVLPDTQALGYTAILGLHDSYNFTVNTEKPLIVPAFKVAQLRLEKGSYVSISIQQSKINLLADLTGSFSIVNQSQTADADARMKLPSIAFQGFRISNQAPKIAIQWLGLTNDAGQANVSGFPVTLSQIGAGEENGRTFISARLMLNFRDKISAAGGFKIYAQMEQQNNKDRFVFKKLQLDQAEIHVEYSKFRFDGILVFIRKDTVYGDGFNGNISFKVDMQPNAIAGSCQILFGNVNYNRYWYFDAALNADKGIPISPAVQLKGFLGGAWQGMRTLRQSETLLSQAFGKSSTGRVYVPDAQANLGLRAGVFLESTGTGAFQSHAVLEMQFLRNDGLEKILIYGSADFLNKGQLPDFNSFKTNTTQLVSFAKAEDYVSTYQPTGKVSAALYIMLDFKNNVYSGDLGLYVNAAKAGSGLIGSGKRGFAGKVSLYFSQTDWYVWVGNSLAPISVQATAGKLAKINGSLYIMTGTKVLPPPDLPEIIQYYTGVRNPEDSREVQTLANGLSFAFGGLISAEAGSEYQSGSLKLYAKANCTVGTDIQIQRIPNNMVCQSTNETPGIDGWFAKGKFYAAMNVKLGGGFKNFNIDVANLGLGLVMSGEGPQPFYGHGTARITVNLAMLKLNADLDFELGEPCDPQMKKSINPDFITITYPSDGATNVSTLSQPLVSFALPVNTPFKDANGKEYRFFVSRLDLRSPYVPKGTWQFSEDFTHVKFNQTIEFGANALHTIEVRVELQENISGKWNTVVQNKVPISETKTTNFRTGNSSINIPVSNIVASWPALQQVNFHKSIYPTGKIVLQVAQPSLFKASGQRVISRFTSNTSGEIWESAVTESGNTLSFQIPSGLAAGRVYKLRLVRQSNSIPLTNNAGGGSTITTGMSGPSGVSVGLNKIPSSNTAILLCEYHFRNTLQSTLSAKSIFAKQTNALTAANADLTGSYSLTSGEYFEAAEWNPYTNKPRILPQIQIQATAWFRNSVNPNLYGLYSALPPKIKLFVHFFRDTTQNGFIPVHAHSFRQSQISSAILGSRHFSGAPFTFADNQFEYSFTGISLMKQDLADLKHGLNSFIIQASLADLQMLSKILSATTTPSLMSSAPVSASTAFPSVLTTSPGSSFVSAMPVAVSTSAAIPLTPAPSPTATLRNILISRVQALTFSNPASGTIFPVTATYYNLIPSDSRVKQQLWSLSVK